MAKETCLIEASKLIKEMAQKSLEENYAYGDAVVRATANEFKGASTPDRVRLEGEYAKTHGQVFTEFLQATANGDIAVVGDRGILERIGSGDVAALGISIEHNGKDLPVVITNRHIKTLTQLPNGLVNVSDVIEAISDAVFQKTSPTPEKRGNLGEIPDEYFSQYGLTAPFNRK